MSTQVNLLPPETRERQTARRQTALVALAGFAVIGVIVLIYVLQSLTAADVQDQVDQQQASNATFQAQVARLQKFQAIRTELEARQGLVDQALVGEISWSNVLRDVSRIIPSRMWLTDLTMRLTSTQVPAAGATTTTSTASPAPTAPATPGATPTAAGLAATLTFSGNALDTSTLSLWLNRLESVPGWVNAWLSKAQKTATGNEQVYQFSSTVDLTLRVLERRGA